ncbi:hypothetical protein [uncultured Bacteroides sp.]|uniref:hypothetical protein n=1 Tax=uncultured Bacteroides sp. TaxID=162156 RepID=UPI00261FA44C|nr:hypothetical protein [uncultured Bacteroides sp.]
MATVGLETQKLMLVREIINSDNQEFLQEMTEACKNIKRRLSKVMEKDSKADTKEAIMKELKKAIEELNDYKTGKIQARPAEELAKELLMEEQA